MFLFMRVSHKIENDITEDVEIESLRLDEKKNVMLKQKECLWDWNKNEMPGRKREWKMHKMHETVFEIDD